MIQIKECVVFTKTRTRKWKVHHIYIFSISYMILRMHFWVGWDTSNLMYGQFV